MVELLIVAIVISFFSAWLGFAIGAKDSLGRAVKLLNDSEVNRQRQLAAVRVAEVKTNQDNYVAFIEKCKKAGAVAPDLSVN